jgi:CRISPR system Cascade subunit CasD
MPRHLLLRLQAPLLAFGGESIDNFGVIREFPAQSMLTGLLASALGWDRADDAQHDRLQQRLVMGVRIDRMHPQRLREFQTAQLGANDSAWTTHGQPEGRAGGAASYNSPHLRYRDHWADADVLLAVRLMFADEAPNLDALADALDRPQRPLFIGRKPCLPAGRMVAGWVDAADTLHALRAAPWPAGLVQARAQWSAGEGEWPQARALDLCDERQWRSGVHGGWRPVCQARITPWLATESAQEVSHHE